MGTGRVMRGGGWNATAHLCRTAFRSGQVPDEASHRLGIRVAVVEVAVPEVKQGGVGGATPAKGDAALPGR